MKKITKNWLPPVITLSSLSNGFLFWIFGPYEKFHFWIFALILTCVVFLALLIISILVQRLLVSEEKHIFIQKVLSVVNDDVNEKILVCIDHQNIYTSGTLVSVYENRIDDSNAEFFLCIGEVIHIQDEHVMQVKIKYSNVSMSGKQFYNEIESPKSMKRITIKPVVNTRNVEIKS